MLMSSVEQIAALDVLQDRQINDNGIVAGDRELLGPWTGFTQFEILNETPPKRQPGPNEHGQEFGRIGFLGSSYFGSKS